MCTVMSATNPNAPYVKAATDSLPDRYKSNPFYKQIAMFEGASLRVQDEALKKQNPLIAAATPGTAIERLGATTFGSGMSQRDASIAQQSEKYG